METSIRPAAATGDDATAFAELADIASNGTFGLLLGSRAKQFLRSVFVLPHHELSFTRTSFLVVESRPVGMLTAASGETRRCEQAATRRVTWRHAGAALPRMAIMAGLLSPVLRVQSQVADETLYVQMVAVWPEWRRRGFGAALMEEAERAASEANLLRVALDVDEDNEPAIGLYRRFGFRVVFRSGRPWIVDKPATVRMVKELSPTR